MEQPRQEAHYENRIYYFRLIHKTDKQVTVNLYSTEYTFIKTEKGWLNAPSNNNEMVEGLINSLIRTIGLDN